MASVFPSLYGALMWAGHFVCHQMPARSPHLFGAQLPLCWRCTGISLGALAFVVWLFARRRLPALRLCAALSLLMPLDVFYALLTGGDGNNARRLATGALWGFFSAGLSLHLLALAYRRLAAAEVVGREAGGRESLPMDSTTAVARPAHAAAGAAFYGTP